MPVSSIVLPPAFSEATYAPALDTARVSSQNSVSGEVHNFTTPEPNEQIVIVPRHAPFFLEGLSISLTQGSTTRVLVKDIDYYPVLQFIGASRAIGKPVIGGVVLTTVALAGSVTINYSCLGGSWIYRKALNDTTTFFSNNLPRLTAWEQYAQYQSAFPIITVGWDKPDPTDPYAVLNSIDTIFTSIKTKNILHKAASKSAISHVFDVGNPHKNTKADVFLGNVANLPAATDAQAADPTNNSTYISHLQLQLAFSTSTPHATDTAPGISKPADMSLPNASQNDVDYLTAAGLVTTVGQPSSEIGQLIGVYLRSGILRNWTDGSPTSTEPNGGWPKTWNGSSYANATALITAMAAFLRLSTVRINLKTGKFWYPVNRGIPPLE